MKTILKMRQRYVSEYLLKQSLIQIENMVCRQKFVKYSPIIGRIKVMKANLLPKDVYLKALDMEISEIVSLIKESKYKEDIQKIEKGNEGNEKGDEKGNEKGDDIAIIKNALKQNLIMTFNKLRCVSQDESKFMITEYLNSEDNNDDNAKLETYYLNLKKAAVVTGDKIFLHFLRRDIDIKNIKNLFSSKYGGNDKIYFIPGGSEFKYSNLDDLISMSLDEFTNILKNYCYWNEIVNEDGKLKSDIGASLDSYNLVYTRYMSKCYPLSIIPIIDYILRKKAEINNLMTILCGKEKKLSREEIVEHLVI